MLAKELKLLRGVGRLSQLKLATKSGVSHTRIIRFELEAIELRADEIAAIRKALAPELVKHISLALAFQSGE